MHKHHCYLQASYSISETLVPMQQELSAHRSTFLPPLSSLLYLAGDTPRFDSQFLWDSSFKIHIWVKSCGNWLCAWLVSLGIMYPSRLLQIPFLWLSDILWWTCIMFSSVASFPFHIRCESCCHEEEHADNSDMLVSFPLDIYLVVRLLNHTVILFVVFWEASILLIFNWI